MAAPTDESLLEKAIGGLPLVSIQGLNTLKAVNFSGAQVDTSGNITTSGSITATGGIINAGGAVTGPTGSFGVLALQAAAVGTGGTGSTATLAAAGASAGGPSAAGLQTGWLKVYVAGSAVFIPTFT